MASLAGSLGDHEQTLDEVLAAFHRTAPAGRAASRQALLDAHPELAEALHECFADEDRIERLAAPLRAAVSADAGAQAGGMAGRQLGDYELLEEIAHGGMSVVYRARQRSLQRLVAVKVLRAGPFASPANWLRFRNEAEAVAQLDHPSIVPIYEVGEQDQLPFFSMKLMESSLAEHRGRYREDTRAAARFLTTVADAVGYAHERGVLHRDLKPANILVDGNGEPHVSDFGLAKRFAADATPDAAAGLTHSDDVVGTPSYMAPEQAQGGGQRITTAADIYGLGAVLYELVTGQPPFRAATVLETLRQLKEDQPARPRTLNPLVDRDLETICLKCLAKEPESRYRTAADLAQDLRRFLAGEMIAARPAGSFERLRSWCRRRPLVSGLLFSVIALFLISFGTVTWMYQRALVSEAAQEAERIAAVEARDQAEKIVDDFAEQLGKLPADMHPTFQESRRQMLQSALKYYQQFLTQRGDDARLQASIGRAWFKIGVIHAALAHRPEAVNAYQQALQVARQLSQRDPEDAEVRQTLSRTLGHLGLLHVHMGEPQKAVDFQREARDVAQALRKERPDDDAVLSDLASHQTNAATAFRALGQYQEARASLEAALPLLRDLVGKHPDRVDYRGNLGVCESNLSVVYAGLGQRQAAVAGLVRARDSLQPFAHKRTAETRYQDELALVLLNLGGQLNAGGERDKALEALREGKRILLARIEDNPSNRENRNRLATLERQLGLVFRESGRLEEAQAACAEGLRLGEQLLAADPASVAYRVGVASCHFDLAVLCERREQKEGMFRAYEQARREWQVLVERHPREVSLLRQAKMKANGHVIRLHAPRFVRSAARRGRRRQMDAIPIADGTCVIF
jgi:serine/threonine-protein kinase